LKQTSIRVFVVEDHEIDRTGLQWLLNQERDMEVVGEAGTIKEARAALDGTDADVLVLDNQSDAIAFCRELAERRMPAAVVIYSATLNDETAWSCISAGARGFVTKNASTTLLKQAIREAARGLTFLDPKVAGKLAAVRAKSGGGRRTPILSPAVMRVLKLAIEGNTNIQIATQTGVSVHTVKSQLSTAYRKLNVRDRAEAAAAAIRLGLI
jgi:DNA-binding NarL/FixJ family response regulator